MSSCDDENFQASTLEGRKSYKRELVAGSRDGTVIFGRLQRLQVQSVGLGRVVGQRRRTMSPSAAAARLLRLRLVRFYVRVRIGKFNGARLLDIAS